jgi:two-component system chemotaxis response regulator CheB
MADEPTRLLIVDDSALFRQAIRNALHNRPGVSIVGVAKNGLDALQKIEELDPDLLTLDIEMPDMDGLGVLREISKRRLRAKAIMVSSLTADGAQVTTDALLEGAFDFILKPSGGDPEENRQRLLGALDEKITAFRDTDAGARARRRIPRTMEAPPEADLASAPQIESVCRAVLIGTSTGGPAALKAVLPKLPAGLPVPVLVVQHMPSKYTRSLARRLDENCKLDVMEAADGTEVRAGTVLIAPGDHQTKLVRRNEGLSVRITDDPHENGCRPSVDYLFRSAVEALDGEVLAVIMTGMGRDGLDGCSALKRRGGRVFAQHEYGCVVYGMPKVVIEKGLADRVLPLGRIGPAIVSYVEQSLRVGRRRR